MDHIIDYSSKNRKDVFHASLVCGAKYAGSYEMPCIKGSSIVPKKLLPFDKAISSNEYNSWVHFYIHDYEFERIWNSPNTYLPILHRFVGVISPDFSIYREMPLSMQIWNTYRSRTIGYWLESHGIPVIPNIRWADERSFDFCFDGVPTGGVIAIGTHGCIKKKKDKAFFEAGLLETINRLSPNTVIVYGAAPNALFGKYREKGIKIIQYDSLFSETRKRVTA